jgi:hypothetical protein
VGIDPIAFYKAATRELQISFALLAVAMELGIGLAIYELRRILPDPGNLLPCLRDRLQNCGV